MYARKIKFVTPEYILVKAKTTMTKDEFGDLIGGALFALVAILSDVYLRRIT
jgi:hypothetical protein